MRLRSGSTGVAVLLQGEWLHVAWLGDSQSMLVRRGQDVTLMDPHKPEREDEKQRIEDLGGCIVFMGCWRVNGTYAVSRAIGGTLTRSPMSLGTLTVPPQGYMETRTTFSWPATVSLTLSGPQRSRSWSSGRYGSMGNPRGPWGGAGCEEVSEGVLGESVAQELVAHAKAAGSSDNITVMVVFLRPLRSYCSRTRATPLLLLMGQPRSRGKLPLDSDLG
ncbi:hypothetical protein J4Q44_G00160470 [Coregonus suidteri]|uniref:PPM-type phosphatase domain-containing protein n=1 Tax=Coregonus suidteri TaxID=861788 RepID=A0AAN8LUT4_9TELE